MPIPVFHTIGLIGKFGDPNVAGALNQIAAHLLQRQLRVLLDESSAQLIPDSGLEVASRAAIGEQCDLVVVMGGDGTMLNAARSLVDYDMPILGVNLGRLGFLADVSPSEIPHRLDGVLNGQFREARRLLLYAQVMRDGCMVGEADALNDVVIHKRDVARMIDVETFLDGRFLNTYRADGLIISTPTGSTAYALAGGGPIIYPGLEAVVLVPICPHTLTHRPIVVGADNVIEVVLNAANTINTQVTCDGQVSLPLERGDQIVIRKKERKVRLIHPINHDYFKLLRAKLRWGLSPEASPFV
ncbi:NAD(+) kinase [Candidatus Competibacter phosphatis]|jgi:NAD+ kinase|uniref:NAD kinase n=1 Tax=Candidatus Competibacter phosphatis TaxID=221280 RepID=A0ABX1TM12_9GAMM|nr:NAD(+) kinase [Candidatus Competibacter phosphatis]NMQ19756.1 NAD(+) kinase [Candidatus Competibacter phosphatis]